MSDNDFNSLNDKEFEILCADILSDLEGHRFERFKSGKDAGVDGRYFISPDKEIILQSKHWANTPFSKLIRELRKTERPKLDELKPHRYILIVSNPLSRANKKIIYELFQPYLVSESDIFGKEDLNDLLRKMPHIEQRHYKLWLHSSNVLKHIFDNAIIGRSAFSLEEIFHNSSKYVVTKNHEIALEMLEKFGVIIISGGPGVGKTTLADHLCLHYVSQGFSYLKIAGDLSEAESALKDESKQIVYFDDFLGRNYLEALSGHEGNNITQFIRRIKANKNKRFVLTSRNTILSQGKFLIDNFDHENIQRTEYELRIKSLTDMNKAQLLYNHIWHSDLGDGYIDQLYFDKRYREIIAHRNFNPRLISFITDAGRLNECPAEEYWKYITNSLNNPSQVWENPFNAQQDDYGRSIIILVVFNGYAFEEDELANAYYRFLAFPENQNLKGRRDFVSNIKVLTGSFLNRVISPKGSSSIDLFNPSIADYVLQRYVKDPNCIRLAMLSLLTSRSLITLRSLYLNKRISEKTTLSICETLATNTLRNNFSNVSLYYIAMLCSLYFRCCGATVSHELRTILLHIADDTTGDASEAAVEVIQSGYERSILTAEQAASFIKNNIDSIYAFHELQAAASTLSKISITNPEQENTINSLKERVIELISDNFTDYIEVDLAFSKVENGDEESAGYYLEKLIEEQLSKIDMDFHAEDVRNILDCYDVSYELKRYFQEMSHSRNNSGFVPAPLAIDEIDDLFERNQ